MTVTGVVQPGRVPGPLLLRLIDRTPHGREVQWTRDPEGPGQCLAALGALEALSGRVEVCSTTRQPPIEVRDDCPGDDDYPNQIRRGRPLSAPDAHSLERVTWLRRTAVR